MAAKSLRGQRELERRRLEVLEVALDLFSRKGFEQTSMAEIAEKANFAVGTLYVLFKDKNALYERLMRASVTEFEEALNAVLTGPGNEVERSSVTSRRKPRYSSNTGRWPESTSVKLPGS